MKLTSHLAAVALACAAARGATAQPAPSAPSAADNDRSETREVEVTLDPAPKPQAENTREEPAGTRPPRTPSANNPSDDRNSADEQSRRAEAALVERLRSRRAANNAPVATAAPSEDQRAIELYRAHFGGQLTKAPYLGVSTSPVPGALRQHLGLPEGVGLVVDFVEKESPAESAGLKRYDILTRFNDQVLVNAQQLAVLVRSQKAGEDVKLALIRGGKEQALSAKLVEKEVKPLEEIRYWNVPENATLEFNNANRLDTNRLDVRSNGSRQSRGSGTTVWRDNDMTLTLVRRPDGGRQLFVKEKSGRSSIYDLDDKDARTKMPAPVAEKLKEMESKQQRKGEEPLGLRFDFAPAEGVNVDASIEFRNDNKNDNDNENDNDNDNKNDDNDADDVKSSEAHDGAAVRVEPAQRPIGGNDQIVIDIRDVHGPGVKTTKLARVFDGKIDLPYLGQIRVEGLTEAELERRIGDQYFEAKISPSVSVRVRKVPPADQPEEHHTEHPEP